MKIRELMTTEVVSVSTDTTLKEVAELLGRHRIAGMPVVDAGGRVIGVVSEGDILWKETGESARVGALHRMFAPPHGEERRTEARTAGEVMSAPPVTIDGDASVAEAARLMLERAVNRLPVLEDGRLVGIVARADLVRAFRRSDEEIEQEISRDVLLHTLWVDPASVSLVVFDGRVTVAGVVENRTTAELVEAYVRRVPGVVAVRSELTWQLDDHARRARLVSTEQPL